MGNLPARLRHSPGGGNPAQRSPVPGSWFLVLRSMAPVNTEN